MKTATGPSRVGSWLAIGAVVTWIVVVITGFRLSYVYTPFSFKIRFYVLLPLFLLWLVYFGFIRAKARGYLGKLLRIRDVKERVSALGWLFLGVLLIPWGVAWTSVAFSAWIAHLYAAEPYQKIVTVSNVKGRGGAKWSKSFDLYVVDSKGGEVILRLNRAHYEEHRWRGGEKMCMVGRTSLFGTIVDHAGPDLSKCK